jgi:hypothetical protein
MAMLSNRAIPKIKATPIYEDGRLTRLKFYCPYCRAWHCHGIPPGGRVAHCWNPQSPYIKTGYVLVLEEAQAEGVVPSVNAKR